MFQYFDKLKDNGNTGRFQNPTFSKMLSILLTERAIKILLLASSVSAKSSTLSRISISYRFQESIKKCPNWVTLYVRKDS